MDSTIFEKSKKNCEHNPFSTVVVTIFFLNIYPKFSILANIEIAQIRTILNRSYVMLEDEWIGLFNGFQYKLSNESLSWNESRKICEAWGSDLIVHGVRDAGTRK